MKGRCIVCDAPMSDADVAIRIYGVRVCSAVCAEMRLDPEVEDKLDEIELAQEYWG